MTSRTLRLIVAIEILLLPLALWAGEADGDALMAPPHAGPMDGPPNGPPDHPGDAPPRDRGRELTEAETAEVLEFVKEHWPEYHARMLQVKEENPRRFRMIVRAAAHRMNQLQGMSEEERDARVRESKLKIEIYRLSQEYRQARNPEDKLALKKEIRTNVAEAFDLEQKVREYGLERLESQLRQLREQLKKRDEQRGEIIDERVEDILRARPGRERGDRPDGDRPRGDREEDRQRED